jgi:hypothetical protein
MKKQRSVAAPYEHIPAYAIRIVERELHAYQTYSAIPATTRERTAERLRALIGDGFCKRKEGVIVSGQDVTKHLLFSAERLRKEDDTDLLLLLERITPAINEIAMLYREKFSTHITNTPPQQTEELY